MNQQITCLNENQLQNVVGGMDEKIEKMIIKLPSREVLESKNRETVKRVLGKMYNKAMNYIFKEDACTIFVNGQSGTWECDYNIFGGYESFCNRFPNFASNKEGLKKIAELYFSF